MTAVPRSELDHRIALLQRHLGAAALDGALIHGITNLYYYTGTGQQAHLWVPAEGTPVLLVRRVLERARLESPLDRIEPLTSLKQLGDWLGGARRIGMELDIMPVTLFQQYERSLPGLDATDVGTATRQLRSIKRPWELERIREAARVADLTYREVQAAMAEGITELELSIVAESADRRHGHQGMLRWRAATGFECPRVHLLAGESMLAFSFADTPFGGEGLTPAAPYGAGRRTIERSMPVCLDVPTVVDGYVHDMTRTLALGGLDGKLLNAYDVCLKVLRTLETAGRPGATGEQLWEAALAVATDAGLEEHFMGYGQNRVKFVGHGVGLELDEWPVLAPRQKVPFEAGMVIAIEPKFFFPGLGAVGLENTYVVTDGGLERLTLSPDDLAGLELSGRD